jgi:aspartate racemase
MLNQKNNVNLIGILGGMGPESSLELYNKLIEFMPIKKEQDHLKLLIYSNPKIPDRTYSILNGKHNDILSLLIESCNLLKNAGANKIIIACNTAHYYLDKIKDCVNSEFYNLIHETVYELKNRNAKAVLILATDATIFSGLYQNELIKNNIIPIIPSKKDQKIIMNIIKLTKINGKTKDNKIKLEKIINQFINNNKSNYIILGCTELSLFSKKRNNILDPLEIIAEKIIFDNTLSI